MYGVNEAGGFVQLTGDIGTGKTTLVRTMLEKMPVHADVAVILNPRISPLELLLSICQELSIAVSSEAAASIKALVDLLNEKLLSAHALGRRVIVIIDEAQNLSAETLEQVRLLTNLETASAKLMQIILIGQPELREVLAHSGLKQLAQRITGRYHLAPLSRDESIAYVRHRLKIAGATGEIFSNAALREVHRLTEGVPRLINVTCDRALLGAYTEDQHRIDAGTTRRAASEVFGKSIAPRWIAWAGGGAAVVALITLAFGVQQLTTASTPQDTPTPKVAAAPITAVEALKPVAAAVDIDNLLVNALPETTTESAFAKLLALWKADFHKDAPRPCEQALAQGLECVYQKGSWGQLRILNRPVILSLTDDGGHTHQVVLTSLNDSSARVALGGTPQEVSLSSLSRVWLGDYLLLWRPQATGQRALAVGMRGDEVRWLRRSLDRLQNAATATDELPNDYYDEALAKRVENFQREHRLSVDGIAGVQTQIVLDSAVDASSAPRLLSMQDAATLAGRTT
jgi:general secretion pathway protein A